MPEPTPAQRKVLEAMRSGYGDASERLVESPRGIYIDKLASPRIPVAPDVFAALIEHKWLRREGKIGKGWRRDEDYWRLTPAGRAALEGKGKVSR